MKEGLGAQISFVTGYGGSALRVDARVDSAGEHVLTLTNTGTANPASSGGAKNHQCG